jgi:hypothetical protein
MIVNLLVYEAWMETAKPNTRPQSPHSDLGVDIMAEAWSGMEHATKHLLVVASAIRRSTVQSQKYDLSSKFDSKEDLLFEDLATKFVGREWPNARRSLCQQVGTAIAVRRKRLLRNRARSTPIDASDRRQPVTLARETVEAPQAPRVSQGPKPPVPFRLEVLRAPESSSGRSVEAPSQLDSAVYRKNVNRGPTLSTISRGSAVQHADTVYPTLPHFHKDDQLCPCPLCIRPLKTKDLKSAEYWR